MFKIILCFFIFLSSYSFSENQKCSSVFKNKTLVDLIEKKSSIQDIQKAIEQGADINARDEKGIDALVYAIVHGHVEIVKLLVEQGADVNSKNRDKETALMYAAHFATHKKHVEIVKLLIQAGADVNARDISGITALTVAQSNNHESAVRVLKEAGAQ